MLAVKIINFFQFHKFFLALVELLWYIVHYTINIDLYVNNKKYIILTLYKKNEEV
jgi:hypothetical protein